MADEDTRTAAEAAAKTGAKIVKQFVEVLRQQPAPVHVDVIARLMGMMLGCLPLDQQKVYFETVITLAALYCGDAERQLAERAKPKH